MSEELTPLEASNINEFLGMDGVEDLDSFKEKFNSTYIRRENVKSDDKLAAEVTGKRLGLLEQDVRKAFKETGFALDNLDTSGKKVEELIQIGLNHIKDTTSSKISELEEQGFKNNDEQFKELENKFEKLNKKYIEEKELREQSAAENIRIKDEFATKLKSNTISTLREQSFAKATFKQGMTELERDGFNARINNNYKLDLDDNGGLVVTDTEGARIANPNVSGTFMTFDDVLRQEAIKNNLYPLNEKDGGKQITATLKDVEVSDAPQNGGRKINRTFRG